MVLLSLFVVFFFFKQKTAYEMRSSDWSSDVCSSDLFPCVRPSRVGSGAGRSRTRSGMTRTYGRRPGGAARAAGSGTRQPPRSRSSGLGRHDVEVDRKSVVSGKSVSVRVDLGGRRFIKKTTTTMK